MEVGAFNPRRLLQVQRGPLIPCALCACTVLNGVPTLLDVESGACSGESGSGVVTSGSKKTPSTASPTTTSLDAWTPARLNVSKWKAVGTHTLSILLHLATQSAGSESVSYIVRPMA